jgi:hypothetical protein
MVVYRVGRTKIMLVENNSWDGYLDDNSGSASGVQLLGIGDESEDEEGLDGPNH